MSETRGRPDGPGRLYREFKTYYRKHRCEHSPDNPKRIFNLCMKSIYPQYQDRMSRCEFLAIMYATLGVVVDPTAEPLPPGLFNSFDPTKYNGKLRLEDHFVNLFKTKFEGNVKNSLKDKKCDTDKFQVRPELGIVRHDSDVRTWRDRELVDTVREALACLPTHEREVVRLTYWNDLPGQLIAALLQMDPRTVKSRHQSALRKLRRHYGLAA